MLTSATSEDILRTAETVIEVHLSKPGGRREGPYSLAQINHDLAIGKYSDTDYWAWYDGLPEWVPLYALPGIASDANGQPASEAAAASPVASLPEPDEEREALRNSVFSGLPASALEQIFMFTTGSGPAQWHSRRVARILKEITGEEMSVLREVVPRHVVGGCELGGLLKPNGSISDAVWHAMAARRPALIQQARERLHRVCVRTFRLDSDIVVAVVLFYNKAKL